MRRITVTAWVLGSREEFTAEAPLLTCEMAARLAREYWRLTLLGSADIISVRDDSGD